MSCEVTTWNLAQLGGLKAARIISSEFPTLDYKNQYTMDGVGYLQTSPNGAWRTISGKLD